MVLINVFIRRDIFLKDPLRAKVQHLSQKQNQPEGAADPEPFAFILLHSSPLIGI